MRIYLDWDFDTHNAREKKHIAVYQIYVYV